jgi:IS5 family transposase
MREADHLLEDEQLLNAVYEALVHRHPKSRTRGRLGVPAEIVVRMLLLKHLRNWSFDVLEREVRPNLLYREFTRVGAGKVPDAKILGRQARALGPEVVKQIHQRVVELAVENKVVQGRKMRVDSTWSKPTSTFRPIAAYSTVGTGFDTPDEKGNGSGRRGRDKTAQP